MEVLGLVYKYGRDLSCLQIVFLFSCGCVSLKYLA